MGRRAQSGFTLVELLVVIAIIGVLVALLLPAVESVRESARRAICSNNLHQLGLGCLQHESAQGFLPTGGWGYFRAGDPDRGFGGRQPGGWHYNILPYIDLQQLHDMSKIGSYSNYLGAVVTAANKSQAAVPQAGMPVAVFNCPTRRKLMAFPCYPTRTTWRTWTPRRRRWAAPTTPATAAATTRGWDPVPQPMAAGPRPDGLWQRSFHRLVVLSRHPLGLHQRRILPPQHDQDGLDPPRRRLHLSHRRTLRLPRHLLHRHRVRRRPRLGPGIRLRHDPLDRLGLVRSVRKSARRDRTSRRSATRPAGRLRFPVRQRPRRRLQHGHLRRRRPQDELQHRSGRTPPLRRLPRQDPG